MSASRPNAVSWCLSPLYACKLWCHQWDVCVCEVIYVFLCWLCSVLHLQWEQPGGDDCHFSSSGHHPPHSGGVCPDWEVSLVPDLHFFSCCPVPEGPWWLCQGLWCGWVLILYLLPRSSCLTVTNEPVNVSSPNHAAVVKKCYKHILRQL